MKRLLSGLLVLALCFSSSFRFSWADTVGSFDADVFSSGSDVTYTELDVIKVQYSSSASSGFKDCTVSVASDGTTVYNIPSFSGSGYWNLYLRIYFDSSTSISSGDYFWFLSAGQSTTRYQSGGSFYEFSDGSTSSYDLELISGFNTYIYSGLFGYAPDSGNGYITLRSSSSFSGVIPASAFAKPCIANGHYYDGAFDPEPGWDEEDGWLGSLIKAIIEGIQKIIDGIVNLPQNIANAGKGFFDMVVNAIVQLGQTILDGLKSLFIPSDGYFEGVASDMQAWLEDHLGLLVYPFTLVADLASRIAAVQGGEPTAHIPEIAYTNDGEKYVLIEEQEVNLYEQVGRNETFLELHQLYLMAMDAAIGGALAFLAWKKFDQITGGSST